MKEVKDKRVEIRLTKKEFNNLLKKIEVSDKKVMDYIITVSNHPLMKKMNILNCLKILKILF